MSHDYNRTASKDLSELLHLPAQITQGLSEQYGRLHALKFSMDQMNEIPQSLIPFYKQLMKALDKLAPIQQEAYQLQQMAKRLPR